MSLTNNYISDLLIDFISDININNNLVIFFYGERFCIYPKVGAKSRQLT